LLPKVSPVDQDDFTIANYYTFFDSYYETKIVILGQNIFSKALIEDALFKIEIED
jgi:hypothetical protein